MSILWISITALASFWLGYRFSLIRNMDKAKTVLLELMTKHLKGELDAVELRDAVQKLKENGDLG